MGKYGKKPILRAIGLAKRGRRRRQLIALGRYLLPLPMKIAQNAHLATQTMRFDRFGDEVDRTCLVTLETSLRISCARRHEDDRNMACPFHATHQFRELEAVHLGHLHIEKRQREVMRE